MHDEMKKRFEEMSDSELADVYGKHRDEYTPEAVEMMQAVLVSRGVDINMLSTSTDEKSSVNGQYTHDDFVAIEHGFSNVDILFIQMILRDEGIPFYVQLPMADSSMLPMVNQTEQVYILHVLRAQHEKALEIIHEHFSGAQGQFRRKSLGGKDRLRSFSFNELYLNPAELEEQIEVQFSEEERNIILPYIDRVLADPDGLEQRLGRVLFYFDHLEDVRAALTQSGDRALTRTDLLTIIEVLQIFCDEENFSQKLESIAESILDFLSQT